MYTTNNFNDLYQEMVKVVLNNGERYSPRGQEVLEVIGRSFKLTNPKNCLCTLKARKLNYRFATIEKLEYLTGESDPKRLCFYNNNMRHFQNDSGEYDGAYGPRVKPQLDWCYFQLKKDSDTRQAVITIRNSSDCHETKDHPCTLSLQFFLRDKKLHLVATMRSNDLLWGTPYDINGFCFLQEVLASWLNVETGDYIHQVGSLHIYTERLEKYKAIKDNDETINITQPKWTLGYQATKTALETFWRAEKEYREENFLRTKVDPYYHNQLKDYYNIVTKQV